MLRFLIIVLTCIGLTSCATHSQTSEHNGARHHDEPTPYSETADAWSDVKATLTSAKLDKKMSIIAMGANWCHDSRALAAQFEKDRFQSMIKAHYKLVYVDVGQKDRNIDIAQYFGVDDIVGTPTVFVVSPDGNVLNLETAPTWRNAASRSEEEIFRYFRGFAHSSPN